MNGTTPIPLTMQTSDSNNDTPSTPVAVSVSPISPSPLAARLKSDTLGPDLVRQAKVLHPTATDGLKLLLLENISQNAVKAFKDHGFQVDHYAKAWSEDELVEKIGSYHAIGIRSKTRITERVLKSATKVCKHFMGHERVPDRMFSFSLLAVSALAPIKSIY
jgi:D-isomer specific 2-hydroxyacid dehydrogenase, catalytic domain